MSDYLVNWTIDIFDNTEDGSLTPRDAAIKALEIMRDNASIATVFSVTSKVTGMTLTIDLLDEV